jgi:hypothetical protein
MNVGTLPVCRLLQSVANRSKHSVAVPTPGVEVADTIQRRSNNASTEYSMSYMQRVTPVRRTNMERVRIFNRSSRDFHRLATPMRQNAPAIDRIICPPCMRNVPVGPDQDRSQIFK